MPAPVVPPARSSALHRTLLYTGFTAAGLLLGTFYHPFSSTVTSPVSPRARPGFPAAAPASFSSGQPGPSSLRTLSPGSPAEESALVVSLREILAANRTDVRRLTRLTTWAEGATEAELKLALTVGWQAARDDDQLNVIDGVILSRLAEIDGEMARETMNTLNREGRPLSVEVKQALFESWLTWDPQGAATGALAQLQQEPEEFSSSMNHILTEIGRDFPGLARDVATVLARSPDKNLRDVGYEAHADLLRLRLENGEDSSGAQAWIEATHVSVDERRSLLEALVTHSLEQENVSDALRVFRQLDPALSPELAVHVVRELSNTAPETARQIALGLPAGKLREEAITEFTRYLLQKDDPAAVFGWLGAQPAHADFDPALERLAHALTDTDPSHAWQCVSRMTDQTGDKRSLSYEIGFQWLKSDFTRASQALPPDLVQRYQRTAVLLQQFAETYPDARDTLSLTWRQSPKSVIVCGGTDF